MPEEKDQALRTRIAVLLDGGLETEHHPRAETSDMVNDIVGRLSKTDEADLEAKLKIAGFTDYVVDADDMEQPCENCMYYLIHRRFCELPELMLPVEPYWSCRLWRI